MALQRMNIAYMLNDEHWQLVGLGGEFASMQCKGTHFVCWDICT
jgi:hypothetical protein